MSPDSLSMARLVPYALQPVKVTASWRKQTRCWKSARTQWLHRVWAGRAYVASPVRDRSCRWTPALVGRSQCSSLLPSNVSCGLPDSFQDSHFSWWRNNQILILLLKHFLQEENCLLKAFLRVISSHNNSRLEWMCRKILINVCQKPISSVSVSVYNFPKSCMNILLFLSVIMNITVPLFSCFPGV